MRFEFAAVSDWTKLADDAIEATYGPGARLHILHPEQGRCIAYVAQYASDGGRTVLAIAGGVHHGEACRMLLQQCYRDDRRPTTGEVATILGVDDSRIRQLVAAGRLTPIEPGKPGTPGRFDADDVWRLLEARSKC